MLVRTYRQAAAVVDEVDILVATDDQRIVDVCREFGLQVSMTRADHLTGSDRIAEIVDAFPAATYINLQGDEPIFNPSDIQRTITAAAERREHVLTGYCPMEESEWRDPKFPRLLFGLDRNLIYIGRAPVPGSKEGVFKFAHRHVCIYAYPGPALKKFSAMGRTPLEIAEDHEIMRFLEMGWPTSVVELSSDSVAVDRPGDIDRVVERLANEG